MRKKKSLRNKYLEPSRERTRQLFNRIAPRYDILNHLLSMGRDISWRKKTTLQLKEQSGQRVLDLATGTADLLISLFDIKSLVGSAVGLDISDKMLAIGREKIKKHGLEDRIKLVKGDVNNIPFPDASFDTVTVAFGVRNFPNTKRSLSEIFRVLKEGGRAIILEFSMPPNRFFRGPYLFYFRYVLPLIGGIISGDYKAYKYLNKTVESFPYGDSFLNMIINAGFRDATSIPLSLGIARIYFGNK